MFLVVATLAVGCAKDTYEDFDNLMLGYREQNKQLKIQRQTKLERGIERLDVVSEGPSPEQVMVSVDLKEARLEVLIPLILKRAGTEFISEKPCPTGTVTARFERRPLVEALSTLLRPSGMTARLNGSMVEINEATVQTGPAIPGTADGPSTTDDQGIVFRKFNLTHLRPKQATGLINILCPVNENDGTRVLTVAPLLGNNSIILSGRPAAVDKAVNMLNRIDVDQGHVLLEALVLEFNVESLLDLGSRIEGGAHRRFSDVNIDFASLVGDTVSFTRVSDAAYTKAYTAVLNMLIEEEDARVISRPYLSTISGTPAKMEIAEDRFVVVQSPGGNEVTLEKITSGVMLDILPVIAADETITLDINVVESRFIATLENVEQRRTRNTISTSTRVDDGQTVIIGGLMLKKETTSKAGIPFLRDLPFLSFLFGHKDYDNEQSQVMIFVTPHRWSPEMAAPVMNGKEWSVHALPTDLPHGSDSFLTRLKKPIGKLFKPKKPEQKPEKVGN